MKQENLADQEIQEMAEMALLGGKMGEISASAEVELYALLFEQLAVPVNKLPWNFSSKVIAAIGTDRYSRREQRFINRYIYSIVFICVVSFIMLFIYNLAYFNNLLGPLKAYKFVFAFGLGIVGISHFFDKKRLNEHFSNIQLEP